MTRENVLDAINQKGLHSALSEIASIEIEDMELQARWEDAESALEELEEYVMPELGE